MDRKQLTTADGVPVADNQNSLTAGARGPVLMADFHLLEKMAHFNRERIPERVVHAKGAGAYGTFTVTNDITKYTKASIFSEIGKTTELFLRFSTVAGEKGSADAERDPRGFAMKFYTDQGNWDLTGNNTPVFFVRDPLKFSDFIHSQKRRPETNLRDPQMMWDFWAHSPESLHMVTWLMGDRGIPATHRNMNGYGSHTFSLVNSKNERVWCKFHLKTRQGIQCLTNEEATTMKGVDPDHATRDLFATIERGEYPRWTMSIQVMTNEQAANHPDNPFDLTKVWPHGDFPLIEVGTLELNKNPENYFAEVEQAGFSPSSVPPGIGFSPDKMLQARLFSYPDAHRYRIGVNWHQLPVNAPRCPANTYHRDGSMVFKAGNSPNYEPNAEGGPIQDESMRDVPFPVDGDGDRYDHRLGNDDYTQAGNLYRLMSEAEQGRLIDTIVGAMRDVTEDIQKLQVSHFARADPEYGRRVAEGLGLSL